MLPAWMIDKLKKDEEPQELRIGDEYVDPSTLDDSGILQKDDTHGSFNFSMNG